ncbi:MAG: AI-2E family transporter [Chthoniobacterales bacterium]|nr:AI-2E family transporter [Chthoniobacterales bacterium]
MWASLTAIFVVVLFLIVGSAVYLSANLIAFLQPILIPVAISAILAYLLDPVVTYLAKRGFGRTKAVLTIFLIAFLAIAALFDIFIVVQDLEGLFYAPRIVGNSVGLHPMTVIVSIFTWGLLIGGLLGPLLAIPLTATIKVLLAR